MAPAWRFPRTAAIRSAATTTSGCSTRAAAAPPDHQGPGRRLHAELVAGRQRDRVCVDARDAGRSGRSTVATSPSERSRRTGGRVDAPSWGLAADRVPRCGAGQSRYEVGRQADHRRPRTCSHSARRGPRRPSSSTCRTAGFASGTWRGGARRPSTFTATMQVTRPQYTRRERDFTSHAPAGARHRAAGASRPTATRSPLPPSATST